MGIGSDLIFNAPSDLILNYHKHVVLKPGETLTFEEMKDFLAKAELPKPYWPKRLEIVGVLPRTPSGKIQKFKLREDIEGKLREEKKEVK